MGQTALPADQADRAHRPRHAARAPGHARRRFRIGPDQTGDAGSDTGGAEVVEVSPDQLVAAASAWRVFPSRMQLTFMSPITLTAVRQRSRNQSTGSSSAM